MLIVCPSCSTSYDVDAGRLGAGRSVRCAKCRTEWFAKPAELFLKAPAGAAAAPAAPGALAETVEAGPADDWEARADALMAMPPGAQTVSDAPPLSPDGPSSRIDADAPTPAPAPGEDVETAAARGAQFLAPRRPARRRSGQRLTFAILALALILGALVGLRTEIVRLAPQAAGAYKAIGLPVNLRGLAFQNVRTSEDTQDGVRVLVVEGDIVNIANKIVPVPRLRFSVRNSAGVEIYAWTAHPTQPMLGREETLPFRSRLASPPADAHDVQVRFFHRRDLERGP